VMEVGPIEDVFSKLNIRHLIPENHLGALVDTTVAEQDGATNPPMIAVMTMLVGIAGAVYGPTINGALQRDASDREVYDTATAMLAGWITTEQTGIR
jgi:hypothetical protein